MQIDTKILIATAALALAPACDLEELESTLDEETQLRNCGMLSCSPVGGGNSPLSGAVFGRSAFDTTGLELGGIKVLSVTLAGVGPVDQYWAKYQLFAKEDGVVYSGTDWVGASIQAEIDKVPVTLTIMNVQAPQAGHKWWLYTFMFQAPGMPSPLPMCALEDGSVDAVALGDLTIDGETGVVAARPNTIFIACLSGAAGKGVYEPKGYLLDPFVLGAQRFRLGLSAIRADYCLDGHPWTKQGNPLVYETKWTNPPGIVGTDLDAAWSMNGPLCLGAELRAGYSYEDIDCGPNPKPPKCTLEEGMGAFDDRGVILTTLL